MGPVNWLSQKSLFMRNRKVSVMLSCSSRSGSPVHEPQFRSLAYAQSLEFGQCTNGFGNGSRQLLLAELPAHEEYSDECPAFSGSSREITEDGSL